MCLCNGNTRQSSNISPGLSVPSSQGEPLQLPGAAVRVSVPFLSVPSSQGSLCNCFAAQANQTLAQLSVPSSQGEPLQQELDDRFVRLYAFFQSPQARVSLCNSCHAQVVASMFPLSVPSSQGEPLRRIISHLSSKSSRWMTARLRSCMHCAVAGLLSNRIGP